MSSDLFPLQELRNAAILIFLEIAKSKDRGVPQLLQKAFLTGIAMPVIVQTLEDPSYQDQQDLQKIYRDAPDWLFAPYSGESDLIESTLADGSLITARFNDRLLGAGSLQRHGSLWYLSHLCVRKVTRRRGVAERLVNQAQKMASQAGAELRLQAPAGHPEVQALAAKLNVALDIVAT